MNGPHYTASKSRSEGRQSWAISFRHPLRTDARGKPGLKVRRGLGTSDEAEADKLVEQLNELLRDETFWSPSARAKAEQLYDPIVIDAFFSGIAVPMTDPIELREAEIPLPTRDEGYSHVLFVGTTGAGKTTALRHLIGSDPEKDRFPSTATGRTTTADIEVVTGPEPYRGVVTFLSRSAVRSFVQECVGNAILAASEDHGDDEVGRRLLQHPDQTFRLNYTLGSWDVGDEEAEDDGWGFDVDEPPSAEGSDEGTPTVSERREYASVLRDFVSRIRDLSATAAKELARTLEVEDSALQQDPETAESWLLEQAEADPAYGELLDDLLAAVLQRFDHLEQSEVARDTTGWPILWKFSSDSRDDFLERVRWFSSNYAPKFGRLLTPIVQGIRVQGPFYPAFTDVQPRLVLLDGQGLGHTGDSASSITTHLTSRFDSADVILLVDSAQQPLQAASLAAVRAVAVGGHQEKLLIAFTHFDLVKGPNLRNPRAKREHLIAAARNGIAALRNEIGDVLVRSIDQTIESRCFTLGWLDQSSARLPSKVRGQLESLLEKFERSIDPRGLIPVKPVYDPASLLFAIQAATRDFHARWDARLGLTSMDGVRKEHWSRVKALNRRIANGWDVEYDTLRPIADLYSRLTEETSRFLERPVRWEEPGEDEELRAEATDSVRRSVSKALHGFTLERLIQDHLVDWVKAFSHAGRGSTFVRAQEIRHIYEQAAPIPGVVMNMATNRFLDSVRQIVHAAIMDGGGKLQGAREDASVG